MATEYDLSFGTILRLNVTGTMQQVPGVKDFDPPPSMFEIIDVTTHSSAEEEDFSEESAAGMKRRPEVTVPLVYKPDNAIHQAIEAAHDDRLTVAGEVEFIGSGRVWAFNTLIPGFTVHAPVNGVYSADMVLKPTGAINRNA